jgi:hypothetical protein
MTPLAQVNGARECQAWRASATFPQVSANFTHAACRLLASPNLAWDGLRACETDDFRIVNQRSDTSKLLI